MLKEFLENVRFFNCPSFRPKEGIFPKPSVLTLIVESQINLLWIPNFTEWQKGEGSRLGCGEGGQQGVPKKERFIEMLISYLLALSKNRNSEECSLKAAILIQRT